MKKPDRLDKQDELDQRWTALDLRKGDMHTRNEKYARWTLPYLYPAEHTSAQELDTDKDSIGARAVNHLSNRVVDIMFPASRPFLRLELDEAVQDELKAAGVPLEEVDKTLIKAEKRTVRDLDSMGHRNIATLAVKYGIVTGNGLMYYPEGKGHKAQVYNTRDYCVVRDVSGLIIEIMTRDCKVYETLSADVQAKLTASDKHKKYKNDSKVNLYTSVVLDEKTKKFKVRQAADKVELNMADNQYTREDLPWIPLTWNLVRGEDYGRGMVEDYRGAFGAISVLSQALLEGVVAAAELKFLVSPSSAIDIKHLNASANGTYHTGRDGDIVTVKSDKHLDMQAVSQTIEGYSRQISQAFLLNSGTTRDAERVTAEEIRADARELETSFGGIYSRFTEDWQKPVAVLLLKRQDIKLGTDTIYPTIVTGLDTLSRLGDLDNYRLFMQDLSLVAALPEHLQAVLDIQGLMIFVGNNRGLDYSKFVKSREVVAAEQEAAAKQQQQLQQAETANQMAQDVGREVAKKEL